MSDHTNSPIMPNRHTSDSTNQPSASPEAADRLTTQRYRPQIIAKGDGSYAVEMVPDDQGEWIKAASGVTGR